MALFDRAEEVNAKAVMCYRLSREKGLIGRAKVKYEVVGWEEGRGRPDMGRARGPLLIPVRFVAKRGLELQSLAYLEMMAIAGRHGYDGYFGSFVNHILRVECLSWIRAGV